MSINKSSATVSNRKASGRKFAAVVATLFASLSLLLAACSGGNDAGEIADPNNLQASAVQVTGSDKTLKATFPVPSKAQNLSTNDLKVGEGTAAAAGSVVQTKYWLFSGTSGQLVDSSANHTPDGIDFELTQGMLVEGFIQGMIGIQAGGERVIVIPPALGYGANVPPGDSGIAVDDTLVFVVQAVKVS